VEIGRKELKRDEKRKIFGKLMNKEQESKFLEAMYGEKNKDCTDLGAVTVTVPNLCGKFIKTKLQAEFHFSHYGFC